MPSIAAKLKTALVKKERMRRERDEAIRLLRQLRDAHEGIADGVDEFLDKHPAPSRTR